VSTPRPPGFMLALLPLCVWGLRRCCSEAVAATDARVPEDIFFDVSGATDVSQAAARPPQGPRAVESASYAAGGGGVGGQVRQDLPILAAQVRPTPAPLDKAPAGRAVQGARCSRSPPLSSGAPCAGAEDARCGARTWRRR
jgi:hypothetical protein